MGATDRRRDGGTMAVAAGMVEEVVMLEGVVAWRADDEYCRKRAIISQSCSRCIHVADRLGQATRCANVRLEKRCRRGGLRFQAACRGLSGVGQTLGSDEVRLRSCPNVRPDTEVTLTPKLPVEVVSKCQT